MHSPTVRADLRRDGHDAVSGETRRHPLDRGTGKSLHPLRSFLQGKRTALARLQREDGTGSRVELSHLSGGFALGRGARRRRSATADVVVETIQLQKRTDFDVEEVYRGRRQQRRRRPVGSRLRFARVGFLILSFV